LVIMGRWNHKSNREPQERGDKVAENEIDGQVGPKDSICSIYSNKPPDLLGCDVLSLFLLLIGPRVDSTGVLEHATRIHYFPLELRLSIFTEYCLFAYHENLRWPLSSCPKFLAQSFSAHAQDKGVTDGWRVAVPSNSRFQLLGQP
jgi:hypothetical protein